MNKVTAKPRVALMGMGIMGGPKGEGIPVLADLLDRLSKVFEITFYAFQIVDASRISSRIKLKQFITWRIPGRLKYLWIFIRFAIDHLFNPYDVIWAISVYPTGLWAIRLGKFFARPVLVHLIAMEAVSFPEIGRGNLSKPGLKKITVKVCKEADVLVAVGNYQKTIAKQSLPTTREIVVLPLRIDRTKFYYKKRNVSSPVQFIHIAYYSPVKDQDTLFLAFAMISQSIDCHLKVIGDGFNIPQVHQMLHKLGIIEKVTFTGIISQLEVPTHFHDAHILIHTSIFESGCSVIQEAMASGVAVCGTNVGILADIGDQFAVIVPAREPELLAKSILNLVNDPERYELLTARAYELMTKYDVEWSTTNYKNLIEEVFTNQFIKLKPGY